jgi:hypothetical protein
MELANSSSRFQQQAIVPVLWIVLLAPLYNGLYFQSTRLPASRGVNTGSGLLLSKPNIFDSIPDPLTKFAFHSIEEMKRYLSGDQLKKRVKNYPTLLRKVMAEICRDMSPQEAFEFRLQTRLDCRFVSYGTMVPKCVN